MELDTDVVWTDWVVGDLSDKGKTISEPTDIS